MGFFSAGFFLAAGFLVAAVFTPTKDFFFASLQQVSCLDPSSHLIWFQVMLLLYPPGVWTIDLAKNGITAYGLCICVQLQHDFRIFREFSFRTLQLILLHGA